MNVSKSDFVQELTIVTIAQNGDCLFFLMSYSYKFLKSREHAKLDC